MPTGQLLFGTGSLQVSLSPTGAWIDSLFVSNTKDYAVQVVYYTRSGELEAMAFNGNPKGPMVYQCSRLDNGKVVFTSCADEGGTIQRVLYQLVAPGIVSFVVESSQAGGDFEPHSESRWTSPAASAANKSSLGAL